MSNRHVSDKQQWYCNGFNWVFHKSFHWIQWQNICHYSKRTRTCHPATCCVRDQDATSAPSRYMWEIGSLNSAQFMLQWFTRFPEFTEFSEFLFHLGKTLTCVTAGGCRLVIPISTFVWARIATGLCTHRVVSATQSGRLQNTISTLGRHTLTSQKGGGPCSLGTLNYGVAGIWLTN